MIQRELLIEKINGKNTTIQELYDKLKEYDDVGLDIAYSGKGYIIEIEDGNQDGNK